MCKLTAKPLIFISLIMSGLSVSASDMAKEKRWAEQIVDSLLVGEPVWLENGKDKFLGIYAENQDEKTLGAAIIVHGIGVHPDWPEVINPIRSELPEHGWSTLSIQMPILANEAKAPDYLPLMDEVPGRINAAIQYLNQQGIENIVIIAHSLGTAMVSNYLVTKPKSRIRAYIGLSMIENNADPRLSSIQALGKIDKPVLDIYGSRDLDSVVKNAADRKQAAMKNKNRNYQQIEIIDANHFYVGQEEELIKRIRGWLNKKAAGSEIKRK